MNDIFSTLHYFDYVYIKLHILITDTHTAHKRMHTRVSAYTLS